MSIDFQTAAREHLPDMRRLALFLTRDPAKADDVVQQALIRGWNSWDSLRERGSARSWFARIVRTTWLDTCKRAEHAPPQDAVDLRPGPIEVLAARQLGTAVERALQALPAEQREAVWLVDGLGFGFAEAAFALGTAIGTTASRVARGRLALRATLATEAREWGIS